MNSGKKTTPITIPLLRRRMKKKNLLKKSHQSNDISFGFANWSCTFEWIIVLSSPSKVMENLKIIIEIQNKQPDNQPPLVVKLVRTSKCDTSPLPPEFEYCRLWIRIKSQFIMWWSGEGSVLTKSPTAD